MAVPGGIEPPFAGLKPAVLTDRRRDRLRSFILKANIFQAELTDRNKSFNIN